MSAIAHKMAPYAAPVFALLVASACYTTVPARADPASNSEVVLQLTGTGMDRLAGVLGRGVASVRGRVVAWTPDTAKLAVIATAQARGDESFWQREVVGIPRDAVANVSERRLSRKRSAIMAALGIGVVVAVQQGIAGFQIGGPGRRPGGPPAQ